MVDIRYLETLTAIREAIRELNSQIKYLYKILVPGVTISKTSHRHDGETLQHDGVNSDGGSFSFTTTGDVTFNQNIVVDAANAVYFGATNTNGSWRIIRSGNNLVFERREAGVWNQKGSFTP